MTVGNTHPKIHPVVIESHGKIKAWNEYVIQHLGLKLVKENRNDYKSVSVYQGTFCLYHNWTVNITRTTNAEMHKYLRQFLERYLEHFLGFKEMAANPEFRPPSVN